VKVGIIGAGAIGMLLASYGAKAFEHITLFTKTKEQAVLLCKHGLQLEREGQVMPVSVEIKCIEGENLDNFDVLFITVKQYHLQQLLSTLGSSRPPAIFFQNGMGHLSLLENVQASSVFVGIMEHGALKIAPNVVRHTGIGVLKLGIMKGSPEVVLHVSRALKEAGFATVVVGDWLQTLENKLIANACINPLTAIFQVENGKLLENKHLYALMRYLFEEAVEVLQKEDKATLWEEVLHIIRNTALNRSSMLRDIDNGNQTEIDAIIGYLLARGQSVSMPHHHFVYESIKALEWKRGVDRD